MGRRRRFLIVITLTLGPAGRYGGAGGRVSVTGMVRVGQGEVHVIPDSRAASMALAEGGGGNGGRHGWRQGHFVKIAIPT